MKTSIHFEVIECIVCVTVVTLATRRINACAPALPIPASMGCLLGVSLSDTQAGAPLKRDTIDKHHNFKVPVINIFNKTRSTGISLAAY